MRKLLVFYCNPILHLLQSQQPHQQFPYFYYLSVLIAIVFNSFEVINLFIPVQIPHDVLADNLVSNYFIIIIIIIAIIIIIMELSARFNLLS